MSRPPIHNALYARVLDAARAQPQALALKDGHWALRFGELPDVLTGLLYALRIEGPVLASRLDNGVPALLVELAAQAADVAALALPPYFTAAQCQHALDQSGARMLLLPQGAPAPDARWRCEASAPWPGLSLWRRAAPAEAVALPSGTACITYTSGSTGAPKGVCLSAEHLAQVAGSLGEAFDALAPRHHLCALPLSTLLETVGAYAALFVGGRVELRGLTELGYSGAAGLDPLRLRAVLAELQPHSLILVPQLLDGLLLAIDAAGPLPQPPRLIAVGGARVAPRLLQRAAAAELSVFEGYGLSEAGSVVCLNRPGDVEPGSVGRPLPHLQLSVADNGELCVDGPRFLGYLGEPAPPPGPLRTGDLGTFHAAGRVRIEGRLREMFITSYGRNVAPAWVEGELLAEAAIAQAVVVGEAEPWNLALIWPRDAAISEAELARVIQRVNAGLPDYARIGGVLRLPAPLSIETGLLTANGRPRRAAVLAHYAEAIQARRALGADPAVSASPPPAFHTAVPQEIPA
jgi:long-chain acyl-CoA synthetase